MTEEKNKKLKLIKEFLEKSLNNSYVSNKYNKKIFKEKAFNINIPDKIISELAEQQEFINWLEKNTEFKEKFYSGAIFEKMNKETIKEILALLPTDKLKEIDIGNIPNSDEFLQELIEKNDEESIKIVKFLNYEPCHIFYEYNNKEIAIKIIDENNKILDGIINNNEEIVEQILNEDESIKNDNKEIAKRIINKDKKIAIKIIEENEEIVEKIMNRKKINSIKIIKTLPIYTLIKIKNKLPKYILNSKEYKKAFIEKFIKRYPIYWNFTDEMIEELSKTQFYNEIIEWIVDAKNREFMIGNSKNLRCGSAFKSLKPETVKNFLLSNSLNERLRDIDISYIPAEILKDLVKDLKENKNEQSFGVIELLNYDSGTVFEDLKSETIEEILKILPDDEIKEISVEFIPEDLLEKLLKNKVGQNVIELLNYDSGTVFEDLKLETIEEILKILPDDKIKKISIRYIPKDFLEKLLKDKAGQNIIKLLKYDSGTVFENLKSETIEEILKILPDDKIKKISIKYIPKDLLEKLLKNKVGQNVIELLDYDIGTVFEDLKSETIEEILKILPDDKIKKISIRYIPKDLLEKLLKNKVGQNVIKLLNYDSGIVFKKLKSETVEEILKILPKDKIEEIYIEYIPTDILINCIKKSNENKELYNNILFLKCKNDSYCFEKNFIRDNEQFRDFLNDSSNIEYVKKFLLDLNDIKRFYLIKYININILKNILLNLSKEESYKIFASDIPCSKFKDLAKIIEQDDYLKILTSLNYSNGKNFYIEEIICNDKKLAKNFLSKLGEEKIKTFNNYEIGTILNYDLFKNSIDYNLKKELLKKLIKENYYIDIKKVITSIDEFVEIIKDNDISQEKANKINLSRFGYSAEDSISIIKKLLKECPNKLPKIDTLKIDKKLLFNCLEKGDLKAENIKVDSNDLIFLIDNDKLKIIKKIIKNKSLFLKKNNNEINYNERTLEILMSLLTKNEIISFVKFYCKNNSEQEIEFDEKKLKDSIENNNLLKKIEDDYFDENVELEAYKGDKSYLKNRQEHLYLLLETLKSKLNKRLNKFEKFKGELDKDIEFRKMEIEENINKLEDYINYLNSYRGKFDTNIFKKTKYDTNSLCDKNIAKEILYFVTEMYSEEVLRRGILDYKRRIESFVKNNEHLRDKADKITKEIEEALGILYYPYSSDNDKLRAQEKLKENLYIIGKEYKKIAKENGNEVLGSYLIFSTICEAKNINEINDALYSTIRIRMANDYLIKIYGNNNLGIKTNMLYRGYTGENFDAEGVSDILTSNPNAVTGRLKYSFWDMTYNNEKNKINIDCVASGATKHGSAVGSFTSYSENVGVAFSAYGAGGLLSFYCIPDNLKKTYNSELGHPTVLEFAGYDVPLEYRIFNIIFDGEVPKEENSAKASDDEEEFKVKAVKFNKKMNFVIFRLNLDLKENLKINYRDKDGNNVEKIFDKDQKNLSVTEEQLEAIIKTLAERGELIPFLRDQLVIERIFDKDKILGEETKKVLKKKTNIHKENVQKTLSVENGVINAQKKFKQVFNNIENSDTKNLDSDSNKKIMYAIPDIHGSIDAFKEDLIKTGLVVNDENEGYVYYKKNDYRLIKPIYEKPKNDTEYIKVPKLLINNDFEDKVVQLGDLVDNHSGEKTKDSLACLATSVLLSRQLNGKYITLVGNHEIAKLVDNAYNMEWRDAGYEQAIIIGAIKSGEIKLMYHVPGTNIINSHVELVKNHIENFLNKIEENKNFFKNFKDFDDKIERLLEIVGFEKDNSGKYIESKNKVALLDNNPSENDLEDFTNIINDLFKYIVVIEYEKGKEIPYHGLTHSLIYRSLVANSRLYTAGKGFGNAVNKLGIEYNKNPLTSEELGQLTFKGITNVIGHDATPNEKKFLGKLSQEEYLNSARILFTDEWQRSGRARCIKIENSEENNKKYYFYRQEDGKNKFIEGDFVEKNEKRKELEKKREIRNRNFFDLAIDIANRNNFNNRREKELFEIILNNVPEFFGDECPILDYCNIKNSDEIVELSKQLLHFIESNDNKKVEFINQLIDDNFFKNYNDEEIFINCINEINDYNIKQEESKEFFDLVSNIAKENNFNNKREEELFEIILNNVPKFTEDKYSILDFCNIKNNGEIVKLSIQLFNFIKSKNKEEKDFINQLINDNFFKNYNDEEIFINCINEINNYNIKQEESKEFFDLASNIAKENSFNNEKEKELFEIILENATQVLSNTNILSNNNILKNKIKVAKLSRQLIELINNKNKEEKDFINQLIKDNFSKNRKKYDNNTIFINCINEINKIVNRNDNQIKKK